VGDDGKITGRFKDADRPRVFSFEILDDIRFSPFKSGRLDNEEEWEDFSLGYSFRFDTPGGAKKKPQCVKPTSYNCGKSCINIKKNCRCNPDDAQSKDLKRGKKGEESRRNQKFLNQRTRNFLTLILRVTLKTFILRRKGNKS
jgi:hypothetical protein